MFAVTEATAMIRRMQKVTEIAIFTPDVPAMRRFYGALLGSPPRRSRPGSVEFQAGEVTLRVHEMPDLSHGAPGDDHIALSVDDVDASCADLRAVGIEPVAGPWDFYWGRSAYFRDPGGSLVELHQSSRGASEP
jgi:catechol 2,3-dioxygenase-like lactoylglutathione lyase family enzyme